MPSILLINDNKIVSRLLQLSSEKNGYNLEEVSTLDSSGDSYDVIFIDSDKYSDTLMGEIESKLNYEQLGYIGAKQETIPEGFNLVIEKPFLPTDFVDMIKEQVISKDSQSSKVSTDDIEGFDFDEESDVLLEEDNLNLDTLDEGVEELLISEDVEDIDDEILLTSLDELDELDDVDLSLDPSLMMTTGVAASMAVADESNEGLADMVSEIDSMKEDTLDPIEEELEPLVEDEITPLEIEDMEKVVLESTEDILEELPLVEDEPDDDIGLIAAVGAGVAAVGGVASTVMAEDTPEVLEDIQEEISTLDDIDGLNEIDLQQALGEEVIEEIVSDEITTDGEETLVESNDVEQWIRDAVAKAITPQMIKEALDGMDVNVTLSFNSKKDS